MTDEHKRVTARIHEVHARNFEINMAEFYAKHIQPDHEKAIQGYANGLDEILPSIRNRREAFDHGYISGMVEAFDRICDLFGHDSAEVLAFADKNGYLDEDNQIKEPHYG